MPSSSNLLVRRPTAAKLKAARAALRHSAGCGCFIQLARNPFYAGLASHFASFHPAASAVLYEAQASYLERVAQQASDSSSWPFVPVLDAERGSGDDE